MLSLRYWIAGAVLIGLLWCLHPRPSSGHASDSVEVTIWFDGLIEGRHIDAVDAFERTFPQYKGILGSSAARTGLDGEGNPQRLMCGIAGGVPPEVVEYDRFAICQWAARNAFLDLQPFIEKDQREIEETRRQVESLVAAAGDSKEIERLQARLDRLTQYAVRPEDYYKATWDECRYKGGQYGVPNYMDDRALYYNSTLLKGAQLVDAAGDPAPPDTWEQLLTKRIHVNDARVEDTRVHSETADFARAEVRPGDTACLIDRNGNVTRCLVDAVEDARTLRLRSPYSRKPLVLNQWSGPELKVFDQDSYTLRLSRWDDEGRLGVVGFEPHHGNGWLFHYGWMNGGEFMSPDGRICTLDDPRIEEALQFTTDVYDSMGGVAAVNAFKKSFQAEAQDPFFQNQIAMFIGGDWFLRDLARYRRDMEFGVSLPPVPRRALEAGNRHVTWVGGFAYCIPATCPRHKQEAAWWLVKYLASPTGGLIMNNHDAQRERAQGRLYMPRLMANRILNQRQLDIYVNIPEMPERLARSLQTFIDLLPYARYRPVSPEGLKLWNAQADAQDYGWNHRGTPAETLELNTQKVQRALDLFYAPARGPELRWLYPMLLYGVVLLGLAGIAFRRFRRQHSTRGLFRREWYVGLGFASPWMIGFIILTGGPMFFSLIMSFTEYDVISPARFIGLANYAEMFTTDWAPVGGVRQALGNTLFMAIGLPLGMIVGLALAMLLNTSVRAMSVYRTTFFLPAIMPVVAASVLWIWVFNARSGLMNWMLQLSGIEAAIDWCRARFGIGPPTPISWLTSEATSKPALIIMILWGSGASMIIWLAGLREIPRHLYEAAALDGAGAIGRFRHVTLPMLSPYILFNLVMGLIGTFQIFTQAYIMTPNGSPVRSTYFYVYKLFDECFSYFRLGYGAAMAWVLFVIVIVLTLINMRASKKWVHYAGE